MNNKTGANGEGATLNINGLGAKPIYYKNRAIQDGEFEYRSCSWFMYTTWAGFNNGNGAWILIDTPATTYELASASEDGLMSSTQYRQLSSLTSHGHGNITNTGTMKTYTTPEGDIIPPGNAFIVTNSSAQLIPQTKIGNITLEGKIGTAANKFVYTNTNGVLDVKDKIGNITTSGAIGSTSGQAVTTTNNGVLTTSSMNTVTATFADGTTSTFKVIQ